MLESTHHKHLCKSEISLMGHSFRSHILVSQAQARAEGSANGDMHWSTRSMAKATGM